MSFATLNCKHGYNGSVQYEYLCDNVNDIANLPTANAGSTAIVATTGDVYILDTAGEWHNITT